VGQGFITTPKGEISGALSPRPRSPRIQGWLPEQKAINHS